MRAMIVNEFGPPETLRLADVPTPVPKPGEVLVEVQAAPVNYVDLLIVGGAYQVRPALPFIPGKGPAGVVTAAEPNVTALRVGDRVLAMAEEGGYAEAVAVDADQCHPLPPRMSFTEAAALSLTYDTAWFALRERARLAPGETVLVLGASGGVGLASVQLGRAMGARVLAGISRPEKATAARAAGADAVIDLSCENLNDRLREQVWAVTENRGANVILDPLGGDIFDAALRALAWCGRLVVIGFAGGRIPTVRTNYLLLRNIEISGLQISDYRKRCPAQVAAAFREIFRLYEKGQVRPMPATVFPLDRASDALTLLRDRRLSGRAVLDLSRAPVHPSAETLHR
jgi:NADPH:quinone reductase